MNGFIEPNRRILIVDENESCHEEFRCILGGQRVTSNGSTERKSFAGRSGVGANTAPPVFEVESVFDGKNAISRIKEAMSNQRPYALVFVDIDDEPGWDGVETAAGILDLDSEIQIVLCTSHLSDSVELILERFGMTDRVLLLKKPFDGAEAYLLATSLTEKWRLKRQSQSQIVEQAQYIDDADRVVTIIDRCLAELESATDDLKRQSAELERSLKERNEEITGTRDLTMFALAQLADSRDPETGEHLQRMRAYAQLLAEQLFECSPYADQIDRQFLSDFYRSTPLHDIGKVGIPDQILLKPGALTRAEFDIMKCHTVIGAEAIEKAARQSNYGGFLHMAADIARHHHEKFDGTGYPHGLKGLDIPLSARITAIADVFDALTSSRVYKEAMPVEEARKLIERESGKHFDPVVVDAFRECYNKFINVKKQIDGQPHSVLSIPALMSAALPMSPVLVS